MYKNKIVYLAPLLCFTTLPSVILAATTPTDLRGTETYAGMIKWEWNASDDSSEFEVNIDGAYAGTTDQLYWVSEGLWEGNHSMTVKAIDDTGDTSAQSSTLQVRLLNAAIDEIDAPSLLTDVDDGPTEDNGNPVDDDSEPNGDDELIDPSSYNYPEATGKTGYELVFSDEFNAYSLNPARWHSQLRWDGEWNGQRYEYRVINGEDQFYVNILSPDEEHQERILSATNPFEFNGSRLAIRAKINPLKKDSGDKTHGALMEIAEQQDFLSGAISTHEKFSRKYGYFEARIKIPSHEGTFPAFWLFHEARAWEGTQRTEIDIMENLGHAPEYIYNSFHYFKNVSEYYGGDATFVKPKPSGQIYTGIDYSDDYHVYAVEWEPGKITWYIDGEQVSELENSEADYEELYLMINLAIGGNWNNFPASAGGLGRPGDQRFPTWNDINEFSNPALEIDYVRVFKRR